MRSLGALLVHLPNKEILRPINQSESSIVFLERSNEMNFPSTTPEIRWPLHMTVFRSVSARTTCNLPDVARQRP